MSKQEQSTNTPAGQQPPAEPDPTTGQEPVAGAAPTAEQAPADQVPADQDAPVADQQPMAGREAESAPEPAAEQQPAAQEEPVADPEPLAEPEPVENSPPRQKAPPRRQPTSLRPKRSPALVADYFTACPRCSFFLVGYRLINQDFDQVAADATGDWLDLSWNLAVRNLVAKSYGYEMAEPFEAIQGVCPSCRRAFIYEAGDEESAGDRFSIQINPR